MNERIPVAPEGYALVRQIGRGASSVVWEARALATDTAVALKILDTDVAGTDALRTFARERDAMTALVQHPNILTILGAEVHDGRPWIAMELCRRGSLASYVADGGPLEVPTVLRVLERLAGALSVAHEAGVVHCDIKPANVMLTDGGEPAVGDFGIARVSVATAATTTGAAFTLDHVAPELLEDGRRSPRSDIYSLGTTAWQLLVGVPPFRQTGDVSIGTVLTRILRRPLPESAEIPDDVLALLRAMTAKDPEDRPESMAEVAAAVRALAEERGVALDDAALPPLTSVQLQLIEIMSDRAPVPAPETEAPAAVEASWPMPDVPPTYVPSEEPEPATVLVGPGATALQESELVGVPLADSLPPMVMPIYDRPTSTGGPQPASRSRRVPLVAASVVGLLVAAGTVFGLQRSEAEEPTAPTPVAVEAPVTTSPPPTTTPTTSESAVTSSETSSAEPAPPPRRTRTTATRRAARRTAVPVPVPAPAPPVVRTPTTPDDDPETPTESKPEPTKEPEPTTKPDPDPGGGGSSDDAGSSGGSSTDG